MIGAIIGDIAGSRYERINHKSKEFKFFDRICRPTDDSVMSLAVAKAILDSAGDVDSLGKTAISAMQELGRFYKNAGYGGTFIKWLWAEEPQPYNSFGNGSAMRVGPCGFAAKNLEEAKLLSTKVTEISHNHPEGLKGAEAIATAVFLARIGKSKEEIRNYITANYYDIDFSLDQIRKTYQFDVSCQGSVPVALEAFFEAVDFEDAIRNAISVGGDSDTIAAMAGAVAEAYFGVPKRIIDSTIEYLDARQMEILYYFEKRYPSKALDEEGKATRTIFEVLDDSVDKVIPAGTTIGVDGEYSSGAIHAWVSHEALQPDFSSFDKKEFRRATKERHTLTYLEFVRATICDLDLPVFDELKQLMLGEYISFSIIDPENVTVDILAEKLCDYFATLEIKTRKPFDKYIEIYLKNLDLITGPFIAKTPPAKRGDDVPIDVPRSRKYYEKAIAIKNIKNLSMTQLTDYTRIMMCLYTAAIKNKFKPIDNFDYAANCLEAGAIVESLKSGKVNAAGPHSVKKRFITKEQYSDDVCTLIILILTLYSIINGMVEGEADYE